MPLCPKAKCKKVRETGTGISVCIAIVGPTYVPSEDCASQKHPAITTHEASLPHSRLQAKRAEVMTTAEYQFRCTKHKIAALSNTVHKIGMAIRPTFQAGQA